LTAGDTLGLSFRATDFIFSQCKKLKQDGWSFRFTVEMVEIYLDKVRDLLADGPWSEGPSLEIRHHTEDPDSPVPGLTSVSTVKGDFLSADRSLHSDMTCSAYVAFPPPLKGGC